MNLDKLREKSLADAAVEFCTKWGTPHFPDQDILNELCYDDACQVDPAWDCMYPYSDWQSGLVIHFNCLGQHFHEEVPSGFSPLLEIWFRYYHQVLKRETNVQVASFHKRLAYDLLSWFYPLHRLLAALLDPVHPWVSDFVQRLLFFSWLRRKPLWA